jgi:tRNA 2-thiouridine synthesizing protein A
VAEGLRFKCLPLEFLTTDPAFGSSVESAFIQVKQCSIGSPQVAITGRLEGDRSGIELPSRPNMTIHQYNADYDLDATGLICPEPLMLVRNKVREMSSAQVLFVQATDPSSGRDFNNFCRFMGHELLAERQEGDVYNFWIKKG